MWDPEAFHSIVINSNSTVERPHTHPWKQHIGRKYLVKLVARAHRNTWHTETNCRGIASNYNLCLRIVIFRCAHSLQAFVLIFHFVCIRLEFVFEFDYQCHCLSFILLVVANVSHIMRFVVALSRYSSIRHLVCFASWSINSEQSRRMKYERKKKKSEKENYIYLMMFHP